MFHGIFHMPRRMLVVLKRVTLVAASGAMLFQTTSCQTTTQELINGLFSAAVTNLVSSVVFGAFGLP